MACSTAPGLQECLELRVKDVDFGLHEIVVRRGKGQKDRRTMLPSAVEEALRAHLDDVKAGGWASKTCRNHEQGVDAHHR